MHHQQVYRNRIGKRQRHDVVAAVVIRHVMAPFQKRSEVIPALTLDPIRENRFPNNIDITSNN